MFMKLATKDIFFFFFAVNVSLTDTVKIISIKNHEIEGKTLKEVEANPLNFTKSCVCSYNKVSFDDPESY